MIRRHVYNGRNDFFWCYYSRNHRPSIFSTPPIGKNLKSYVITERRHFPVFTTRGANNLAAPPLIPCNTETTDNVDHRILHFPQVTNTTFAQTKQPLSSPIPTAVIQQYHNPSHPRIPHPPCQRRPLPDQLHAAKQSRETHKWFRRRQKRR